MSKDQVLMDCMYCGYEDEYDIEYDDTKEHPDGLECSHCRDGFLRSDALKTLRKCRKCGAEHMHTKRVGNNLMECIACGHRYRLV